MAKRKRGNTEGSIYHMKDGRWRAAVMVGLEDRPGWKAYSGPPASSPPQRVTKWPKDFDSRAARSRPRNQHLKPGKQNDRVISDVLVEGCSEARRPANIARVCGLREASSFARSSGSVELAKLSPQHVRAFLNEKLTTPQPSRKKVKETIRSQASR